MGETLNLWQKLAVITGDIGAIEKDGSYSGGQAGGSYKFISQAQLVAKLRHELKKHRVVIEPSMVSATTETITRVTEYNGRQVEKVSRRIVCEMEFRVVNGDDPTQHFTARWFGEAIDSGDKGTQKAATSAEKYFLMKLFKVSDQDDPDAEGEEDGEEDGEEAPRPAQVAPVAPAPAAAASSPAAPAAAAAPNGNLRPPRIPTGLATAALSDVELQGLRYFVTHGSTVNWQDLEAEARRVYPISPDEPLQVRHFVKILQAAQRHPVAGTAA